jgi:hypothetical protein
MMSLHSSRGKVVTLGDGTRFIGVSLSEAGRGSWGLRFRQRE